VTVLDQLVTEALARVERAAVLLPPDRVRREASDSGRRALELSRALDRPGTQLIAEFKRRSPSAGAIGAGAWLPDVISAYECGGAAAISVLTEPRHFGGWPGDLRLAREMTTLPLVRKDIIVDSYQVFEAAAWGADAVLLIVRAVSQASLRSIATTAFDLGLDVIIEVHDRHELDIALGIDAAIIGINQRDLTTFTIDPQRAQMLRADVPPDRLTIAESGVHSPQQVRELSEAGFDAVLVGTSLMRVGGSVDSVRELRAAGQPDTDLKPV